MKRKLLIAFRVILILVILGILGYAGAFYYSVKHHADWKLPETAELSPSAEAGLGGDVRYRAEFDLPLYRKVTEVRIALPETLVAVENPEISVVSRRFLKRRWRVSGLLRGIVPGKSKPGELLITLSPVEVFGKKAESRTVAIPSLRVKSIAAKGETPEISAEPEAGDFFTLPRLLAGAAVLVLAGIAVVFWYVRLHRKVHTPPLMPWEKALAELTDLKNRVQTRNLAPASAIASLTDVVRRYLEQRFALPYSKRTTTEFLQSMDVAESPLSEDQRCFLRDFLSSADLVKFARAPVSPENFNEAENRAEKLVAETRPPEDGKEVRNV